MDANDSNTSTAAAVRPVDLIAPLALLAVTAAIYLSDASATPLVVVYAPVVAAAAYLCGRVWGLAQAALAAFAYGALLALDPPSAALGWWLLTATALAAVAELTGRARAQVDQLRRRLQRSVRTDALTGLLNRRAFESEFDLELERSRRSARPLSLMVADLDNFKDVNGTQGHQAGDAALARFGAMLADRARRVDLTARVDGEQFALLLPGTDETGAYMFAERLRDAVREVFASELVPLTISFGIASYPAHGYEAGVLMRAADHALYTAKALGRNRTVICNRAIASAISTDVEAPPAFRKGRAAA
jgi:diguanylate cyclase (GGDEF)-like protein